MNQFPKFDNALRKLHTATESENKTAKAALEGSRISYDN